MSATTRTARPARTPGVGRRRARSPDPARGGPTAAATDTAASQSADLWCLAYDGFDPAQEGLREALCTLGNGYLATRGAAPESRADGVHYPGTYLAGCYDRLASGIAGRVVENEDLVNAPNWLVLRFRTDGGRWVDPTRQELREWRQELDLRRGVLTRLVRFRDRGGRTTSVTQRRLVSLRDPHLAALETTFLAEDWSGPLTVRSGLDGGVMNAGVARYRALRGDHLVGRGTGEDGDESIWLEVETRDSGVRIAQAARTRVWRDGELVAAARRLIRRDGLVAHDLDIPVEAGVPVTVEKVVAIYTSRDAAIYEPALEARSRVADVPGFDGLLERHVVAWDHVWDRFDTRLEGSERAQLVLRVHLFHLLQTASEHTADLDVGIPARGLHGEAYRGHIFWDELFILPLLDLHLPILARAQLTYRFRRLDEARRAASGAGYGGAMYPWQSASSGRETSQSWHLNPKSGRWLPDHSHLQRHIGIAIAYDAWQHYEATGDVAYLRFRAAPMVLEIARFLASACSYNRATDRYVIRGVMGPDEYHDGYPDAPAPGLDNNAYTNVMTVWVVMRALELLELLPPHYREELLEELDLTRQELDRWEDVTRRMHVPFHGGGIISQFDGYDRLQELDWEGYRLRYGDIQRLDRILEAEGDTPNRYKASKQADVLMLLYLLSSDQLTALLHRLGYPFDPGRDIPRNVEYYLQRTSHGSTLSRLVHSWVLSRLDRGRSWSLLLEALESDVADVQGGTTAEGIHLGAMAGTVDLVQRGYGGIETRDGTLWLNPRLPDEMRALAFSVHFRGQRLAVDVRDGRLRIQVQPGLAPPIRVGLRGRVVTLGAGESREVPLA